ncbi:type II toxin-antitoxin system VapC family toxin [Caulobacter sp. NIBR1757]|uniref:type II toxin-antitoxin system VapC family toxin n=1 Tax=Caulobacter sp. NIBR1757 TaxID=3016000 RepID=UPI0022F060E7|nr:type II toxin-antitoxin system VapC family toxin [Caulobacter sp. NIBR1757]WGM38059.1 tRNA(fMet)-specific endonuclease VapC [Caulobacter sp. NIBR1757]
MFMLDTSVAIDLRDGSPEVTNRVQQLRGPVVLSIITRIELEGGVHRIPGEAGLRRERLDTLLSVLPTVPFDDEAADIYRAIIETCGFSRRKMADRMIAAQALIEDATLVTLNPDDFRDIPGLKLLAW